MTRVTSKVIKQSTILTVDLADDAVTQAKLADDAVGTNQIADGAVTSAKLASGVLTTGNLSDNGVTTVKLADDAVTQAKLADGAVGTDQIAANAINSEKIENAGIESANIADGAVTTTKIANGAITSSKIATGAFVGSALANGSVPISKIEDIALGSIVYGGTDNKPAFLAPGPASSVLSMIGGVPQWVSLLVPTGLLSDFFGTSAPDGWLFCDGKTIGPTNSGGTALADTASEALFKHLWNSFPDSVAPVSTGRGSSANDDWSAGTKTITLPDLRGRSTVGVETDSSNLSGIVSTDTYTTLTQVGQTGGNEKVALAEANMPEHAHLMFLNSTTSTDDAAPSPNRPVSYIGVTGTNSTAYYFNFRETFTQPDVGRSGFTGGTNSGSASNGTPHNNMMPSMLVSKIIKL